MGSFSWLRADTTTKRNNLTMGDRYKILVPQEFGGGFIEDTYYDYGDVFHNDDSKENADLYGILSYWNKCKDMVYDGDKYPSTMEDILKRGRTRNQNNRSKGIDIGCYNWDIARLKYPLKLVSLSYKGTYEDCEHRSYGDPNQGFCKTCWDKYTPPMKPDEEYYVNRFGEETFRYAMKAYKELNQMKEEYENRVK